MTKWNRPKEEWAELGKMSPFVRETIIAMRNSWEYRTGLPALRNGKINPAVIEALTQRGS